MISFIHTIGFRLWIFGTIILTTPFCFDLFFLKTKQYQNVIKSSKDHLLQTFAFKQQLLKELASENRDLLGLFITPLLASEDYSNKPQPHLSQELTRFVESTSLEIALAFVSSENSLTGTIIAASDPARIGSIYQLQNLQNNSRLALIDNQLIVSYELLFPAKENPDLKLCLIMKKLADPNLQTAICSKDNTHNFHTLLLNTDGSLLHSSIQIPPYMTNPANAFHPFSHLQPSLYKLSLDNTPYLGVMHPIEIPHINLAIIASQQEILAPFYHSIFQDLIYLFVLVSTVIIIFYLIKKMHRPVNDLVEVMISLSHGDTSVSYQDHPWGFEINHLGQSFNSMKKSLLEHQQLKQKEKTQKELFLKELALGKEAQKTLLPTSIPNYPSLEIACSYLSAIMVGGDFYDLFSFEDNHRIFFILADASGKGVQACFYSLMFKNILKTHLKQHGDISTAIKAAGNLFLKESGDSHMFITAFICCYNSKDHTLHYYSCGHPPAYLIRTNGQLIQLSHPGMAVGFIEETRDIQVNILSLKDGDFLLLYSDGLTDAQNSQKELFGKERLEKALSSVSHESAQKTLDALLNEIHLFSENTPQYDDMTTMVVKVRHHE